ncbi:MAG TPA: hypothetical protein VJL87_03070, partial [Bdellovibrionota bacterium]|nr:hypothetical protein [Bdellovibrionota bacterium]
MEEGKYRQDDLVEAPDYTEEELVYRAKLICLMEQALTQKNSPWTELDDMTWGQYYDTNRKTAHSYSEPRKNKEEVRVVTGTVQEKEITLLSSILGYNLEPFIYAYDENNMLMQEVGREMADLVKKSREIENYDYKRPLIYKELLDQGDVFVEEQWVVEADIEKKIKDLDMSDGVIIKKIKWDEKVKYKPGVANTELIEGKKVYLGNMKEFFVEKQPFIFTAEHISYAEAKSKYGNWDRFKHVQKRVQKAFNNDDTSTWSKGWGLLESETEMVEVIKFQAKYSNEYMIFLNGVMMLPCGFPLTFVSPSGEYTITKGNTEAITKFFALGKSFPAKTKVDKELLDEMLRLMILKIRQSYKPPMANNTNRVLSRSIFEPGQITPGIDVTRLQPLITPTGVTQSEFSMYQFLKNIVDEKTANPVFSGDNMQGDATATQIREMKKQQMMKMGLAILGVIQFEQRLAWKRIHTILKNWSQPVSREVGETKEKIKNVYRQFSMESSDETGEKVTKVFQIADEIPSQNEVNGEADMLSGFYGHKVKKIYLSA